MGAVGGVGEDELVGQGELLEAADVVGVLVGDEDAADGRVVGVAGSIEVAESRQVLESVEGDGAGGAEVDKQGVVGLVLVFGSLGPGLDEDVGLEVAFGENLLPVPRNVKFNMRSSPAHDRALPGVRPVAVAPDGPLRRRVREQVDCNGNRRNVARNTDNGPRAGQPFFTFRCVWHTWPEFSSFEVMSRWPGGDAMET